MGSGPVGVSLAANLSFSGIGVYLLSRKGLVKDPISYQQFEKSWLYEVKSKHPDFYDIVFICTKAYDIENGLKSHKEVLLKSSRIVFMTNGYTKSLIESLSPLLAHASVEFAVTDRAIARISASEFEAKKAA